MIVLIYLVVGFVAAFLWNLLFDLAGGENGIARRASTFGAVAVVTILLYRAGVR